MNARSENDADACLQRFNAALFHVPEGKAQLVDHGHLAPASSSSEQGSQATMQQTGGQPVQSGSQDSSGPEMSDVAFQQIDANSDSRISRQEAQQANDSYLTRTFDGIDVNGNGYIEKDEIKKDGR